MADRQSDDDVVLHQDSIEDVASEVAAELIDGVTSENTAIANLVAITGGESPTETEYNLVVTKVNAILAALRSSGVIPAS